MIDKSKLLGQYKTPALVADLVLGFCLKDTSVQILDPSCGDGVFLARAGQLLDWLDPSSNHSDKLWGIELDIETAEQAQLAVPQAHIISRDFFEMDPWPKFQFDAIVGNPPYTRSEWISQLSEINDQPEQLLIFKDAEEIDTSLLTQSSGSAHLVRTDSDLAVLGSRAGLHAFFFIHGLNFLKEGGRFGFVLPNSWLDVAYGERLKRFLLEHYRILAIIESNVERWFRKARVNACIIILEKCSDFQTRMSNSVHLIRLKRPLSEIVPFGLDDKNRLGQIQGLTGLILGGNPGDDDFFGRVLQQSDLGPGEKWGIYLRSSARLQKRISQTALHPLGSWAKLKRGYTTGANAFFYLNKEILEQWPVEEKFRKPLLKSLRHILKREVSTKDTETEVLLIDSGTSISGTAAEEYIEWGQKQRFHLRSTCASRHPWYSLPDQGRSPLLLPKGIWERHFSVRVDDDLLVDQQIYRVTLADGVHPLVAAALLNSAWFSLQLELNGRVNFGEGVLWLAQYELEDLLLPDPRYLAEAELDILISIMNDLIGLPVKSMLAESKEAVWTELNDIIFNIMGFPTSDQEIVMNSLNERLSARLAKARNLQSV